MSKISERIKELVKQRWSETQSPLLLVDLGVTLRNEFGKEAFMEETRGAKLLPYVQHTLKSEVTPVQDPSLPVRWGLIPATEKDFDLAELFARGKKIKGERPRTETIRYDPVLWSAFTRRLAPDTVRYVTIGDTITFEDLSPQEPPPPNALVVKESDLPDYGKVDRDQWSSHVSSRITDWATKQDVNLTRHVKSSWKHRSPLELILDVLSEEDLRRIALPLDVIKVLSSKKL